jgi:uncharacterized phage protein (TIGR01671 family)
MREIKFRAWSKNIDEHFMAVQGEPDLETLQSFMFHYGDEQKLMQFTGLKDKKGNDIYEGDIVTFDFHSKKYEVIWYDGAYYLRNGNQNTRLSTTSLSGYYVIGNILENPEMLLVYQAIT